VPNNIHHIHPNYQTWANYLQASNPNFPNIDHITTMTDYNISRSKNMKDEEISPEAIPTEITHELDNILKSLAITCNFKNFLDGSCKIQFSTSHVNQSFIFPSSEMFHLRETWDRISIFQFLSEPLMVCFNQCINWPRVSRYQTIELLSEKFINRFVSLLDWTIISQYQALSEHFIEKHQNYLKWPIISQYQIMSENFIRKFQNNVDWNMIAERDKILSTDFIIEFCHKSSKFQEIVSQLIQEKRHIDNAIQYLEI
jgi:hypothetical protein